jgi:hypothetical protein
MFKVLVENGADVDAKNSSGDSFKFPVDGYPIVYCKDVQGVY